jgi:hypothetical protein
MIEPLFTWNNFKWASKELIKMYSNQPSFFSYKRFQTGVAFFMFTQGSMYALKEFVADINGFLLWCVPVLLVCGYTLNTIQKEKLN